MEKLWQNGPEFIQAPHFKFGTDSVLLSDFVKVKPNQKILDIGCASGIISLLILTKYYNITVTGIDIVSDSIDIAVENMRINNSTQHSRFICGDIKDYKNLFSHHAFDCIVCNPPYFNPSKGKITENTDTAAARAETQCTIEDIITASRFLLPTGGKLNIIYRPQRLTELLTKLSSNGLEPKRLRFVHDNIFSSPSTVMIEAARGGNPGLTVEPPLIIHNDDGSETCEIKRIYHR